MSWSPRWSVWAAALIVGVAMAGLALQAFHAVRRIYLERAEVRLMPVLTNVYVADNAALPPARGRRIVFFGDSRIWGWRPRPDLAGAETIWRGVGGETTAQMTYRIHQDVIALQPDAVVIEAGINDLVAGAALGRGEQTASQTVGNLRSLAEAARSAGIRVYLLTILRPARWSTWRWALSSRPVHDLVDQANEGVRALAGPGIVVLDADRELAGDAAVMPGRYSRDTLHLNEAGYVRLNTLIERSIGAGTGAVQ